MGFLPKDPLIHPCVYLDCSNESILINIICKAED